MTDDPSDAGTERQQAFVRWLRYHAYRGLLTAVRKEQAKRNHMKAEGYDV